MRWPWRWPWCDGHEARQKLAAAERQQRAAEQLADRVEGMVRYAAPIAAEEFVARVARAFPRKARPS